MVARLIEARASKRLTQSALAEAAGLTQSYVSQFERGEINDASWRTIMAFEKALGLEPGYLTRDLPPRKRLPKQSAD